MQNRYRIKPILIDEPVKHPDLIRNREPVITGKELLFLIELYSIDHSLQSDRLEYIVPYDNIFASKRKEGLPQKLQRSSELAHRLSQHVKNPITLDKKLVKEIFISSTIPSSFSSYL